MSGERIILAGGADSNAALLVHATARLADANLGPYANDDLHDVIGPLAERLHS